MTDPRSRVLISVDEARYVLGAAGAAGGGTAGVTGANGGGGAAGTPGASGAAGSSRESALPGASAPVVLDVRWTLPRPDGRKEFAAGHIPGARYVAMDTELSDHSSGDPTRGRHPLPSVDAFEATVRSWGVHAGTPVIVYDDVAGQAAARAWWMLRWVGHENVRVLDGGWTAWREAGLPVETGTADPGIAVDGGFVARPGSMPVLSADDAAALAASDAGVLLDARAPERFEGRTEPMDPRAGHIPGALNAPAGGNTDDGFFRAPDALADYYRAVGAVRGAKADAAAVDDTAAHDGAAADDGASQSDRPVVGAYCGSGVSASHTVLALASIGIDAALFPGSWSAWSNDPDRPVATGAADDETVVG